MNRGQLSAWKKVYFLQNFPDGSVHHAALSSMGNEGRDVSLAVHVI
jgi:hypothetical protein